MTSFEDSLSPRSFFTLSRIPYHKIIGQFFSLPFIETEMGSQKGQSTFKVLRPETEEVRLAPHSVPSQRFGSG